MATTPQKFLIELKLHMWRTSRHVAPTSLPQVYRGTHTSGARLGDAGFHTFAYWQTPSNWKKHGFRKPLTLQHFHRVTRWHRVT